MVLIELNPKSTRPETEFSTATPEFVAKRNRITLANRMQLVWVVIGVAEELRGRKICRALSAFPWQSSKLRQKNV